MYANNSCTVDIMVAHINVLRVLINTHKLYASVQRGLHYSASVLLRITAITHITSITSITSITHITSITSITHVTSITRIAVKSGCLAHVLIEITAKYYAPHSELRQITRVGPAGIANNRTG